MADLRVTVDVGGVGRDSLGDAEVDQLETATNKEEVGRLEISVYDAGLVDHLWLGW